MLTNSTWMLVFLNTDDDCLEKQQLLLGARDNVSVWQVQGVKEGGRTYESICAPHGDGRWIEALSSFSVSQSRLAGLSLSGNDEHDEQTKQMNEDNLTLLTEIPRDGGLFHPTGENVAAFTESRSAFVVSNVSLGMKPKGRWNIHAGKY